MRPCCCSFRVELPHRWMSWTRRPITRGQTSSRPPSAPFASAPFARRAGTKLVNHSEPETDLLRHQIEAALDCPRPAIVAGQYQPLDRQSGTIDRRVLSGVMIETALRDCHWLLVRQQPRPTSPVDRVAVKFSRTSFVAWLAISILLGVLLSHLAARRLIRPVLGLATAVEQFGGSGDALPLAPAVRGRCER